MRPGVSAIGPGAVLYSVNADGFRDHLYARPKPDGTFRILILGHSVAFGWAVAMEQSYPKILEARLAALSGGAPRIEVLNVSVCAYNAYLKAALFADIGESFAPDLVIVEFSINDLNDPTMHFDGLTTLALSTIPEAAFPDPARRFPPPPPPSLGWRLCRLSELCVLAVQRFSPTLPNAAWLRTSAVPREEHSEREMSWLETQYGKVADEAARIGARFAIAVLPYSNQVAGTATARVQERLEELGRKRGWPIIDLLPGLRRAARPGDPFFLDLWHLTPHGHQVVAEELSKALCCKGLLPLPSERCCPDDANSSGPAEAGRVALEEPVR
jgi:lysophospholipase L1-like esterase